MIASFEMVFSTEETAAETASASGRPAEICIAARVVASTSKAAGVARADGGSRPVADKAGGRARLPPCQSVAQMLPAPGQSTLDRANRAAQVARGLFVGAAFEIAEHERATVTRRDPLDLLMDRRTEFLAGFVPARVTARAEAISAARRSWSVRRIAADRANRAARQAT